MGCPYNIYEAIFVMLFFLVVYVMFAITLNIIWDYISDYREYDQRYNKQIIAISRFMKVKEIDPQIAVRVYAYMEHFMNKEKSREYAVESEIIEKLPDSLKDELIYNANGYFLEFIPWLKNNFSIEFLR